MASKKVHIYFRLTVSRKVGPVDADDPTPDVGDSYASAGTTARTNPNWALLIFGGSVVALILLIWFGLLGSGGSDDSSVGSISDITPGPSSFVGGETNKPNSPTPTQIPEPIVKLGDVEIETFSVLVRKVSKTWDQEVSVVAQASVKNNTDRKLTLDLVFRCSGQYYVSSLDEFLTWDPTMVGTVTFGPNQSKWLFNFPLGNHVSASYDGWEFVRSESMGVGHSVGYIEHIDKKKLRGFEEQFFWDSSPTYGENLDEKTVSCEIIIADGEELVASSTMDALVVDQKQHINVEFDLGREGSISFGEVPISDFSMEYATSSSGKYEWVTGYNGLVSVVSEKETTFTALVTLRCHPRFGMDMEWVGSYEIKTGLNTLDLSELRSKESDLREDQVDGFGDSFKCSLIVSASGYYDHNSDGTQQVVHEMRGPYEQILSIN